MKVFKLLLLFPIVSLWNKELNAQWSLTGNSGTTSSNFIGTTDAQPLIFKTNNTEAARILSNGNFLLGSSTDQGSYKFQATGDMYLKGTIRFRNWDDQANYVLNPDFLGLRQFVIDGTNNPGNPQLLLNTNNLEHYYPGIAIRSRWGVSSIGQYNGAQSGFTFNVPAGLGYAFSVDGSLKAHLNTTGELLIGTNDQGNYMLQTAIPASGHGFLVDASANAGIAYHVKAKDQTWAWFAENGNAQIGLQNQMSGTQWTLDAVNTTLNISGRSADIKIGTDAFADVYLNPGRKLKVNLGSDATGDIYYRNSSGDFTRLALGTSGQVLTVSGGLPQWANSTGGGGGSYIENQNSSAQTASYWISGSAKIEGGISSPNTAYTYSERFGAAAVAANIGATAVGNNASVTGYGGTSVGANASVTGIEGTALGSQASAGQHGTAVGANVTANDGCTLVGNNLSGGIINMGWGNVGTHSAILLGNSLTGGSGDLMMGYNVSGWRPLNVYLGGGKSSDLASAYGPLSFHALSGEGTNIPGQSFVFHAGKGTGNANGGDILFYTTPAGTAGSSLNAEVERMRIDKNGRVGIGTSNIPADYKLAVAGNIIAEKVKVKLQSSGWPDYVFEPSYKLLPLKDVEKFIQQNQHLPEVPSAAEVEKNGLDLGDNQSILLKKIEELTLYMIDINKKMEKLEAENETLKKKLETKEK